MMFWYFIVLDHNLISTCRWHLVLPLLANAIQVVTSPGVIASYLSECLHVSTWPGSSALLPKQAANHSSAFFLLYYLNSDVNEHRRCCIQILLIRVGMQTSSIKRPTITNASGGSDPISVPPTPLSPPSISLTHFWALGIIMTIRPHHCQILVC